MKILIFPKDPNPYQELLYGQMGTEIERKYLDVSQQSFLRLISFIPILVTTLLFRRLQGFRLIHIHWVYPFYVPARVPFHKQLTFVQILGFYSLLRLFRFKVIWTVHNVLPQIPQTPNDRYLMQRLSRLAAAKIVHAKSVIAEMESEGLDTTHVSVIPHGSYVGVYPDKIDRDCAREELKIKSDDVVFLLLGNIARYKGVTELLQAMSEVTDRRARLILAGKCNDAWLRAQINKAAKSSRIDFYEGRVPDVKMAAYFNASDVACLPFSAITTSGSTILALSFGKPVIVPRMGALKELPDTVGYFYDPKDPKGLLNAMKQAIYDKPRRVQAGRKARVYAEALSWDKLAARTTAVYREALSGHADEQSIDRGQI